MNNRNVQGVRSNNPFPITFSNMNLYSNSHVPLVNIQSHIKLVKITSTDIMSVTDPSTHNLKSNPREPQIPNPIKVIRYRNHKSNKSIINSLILSINSDPTKSSIYPSSESLIYLNLNNCNTTCSDTSNQIPTL